MPLSLPPAVPPALPPAVPPALPDAACARNVVAGKPITKDELGKAYVALANTLPPGSQMGGEMDAMVMSMLQPPKSRAHYKVVTSSEITGGGGGAAMAGKAANNAAKRRASNLAGGANSDAYAILNFKQVRLRRPPAAASHSPPLRLPLPFTPLSSPAQPPLHTGLPPAPPNLPSLPSLLRHPLPPSLSRRR